MDDKKTTCILIVDDEPYMREVVEFDLEKLGYQIIHASSGREAIDIVKSSAVDLVITDVRMPSGTGVDLLRWIKEWNSASPSVIFMTAFADISADEALDQGAEGFLNKPIFREGLMEEVTKVLLRRSERWMAPVAVEGTRRIAVDGAEWPGSDAPPRMSLGTGGVFVEMQDDFPSSLEIVEFDLPLAGQGDSRITGVGRVRWVRHEGDGGRPAGIGLEFLYLADESRRLYLEYLENAKPRAYVPLGEVA